MRRRAFALLLRVVVGPYWATKYHEAPEGTAWK